MSVERQHWTAPGFSKGGYATRGEAKAAIRRGRAKGSVERLAVYRCDVCDRWHIGHDRAPTKPKPDAWLEGLAQLRAADHRDAAEAWAAEHGLDDKALAP